MAERGTYRSISCSLLSGKDFRKLPERPRWIFVVLKLNIGPAGIDTWYPDELLSRLVSESGANADQVKLALDYLEHENWIEREDNVIWVKGHITHDPHLTPANPKHRKAVQRQIAGLPRLEIVRHFCLAHPEWVPPVEASVMGIGWVSEPIAKGMAYKSRNRNRNRIPKEDTENEREPTATASAKSGGWVARFGEDFAESSGGIAPLGKIGAACKPLVDRDGEELVRPKWKKFCASPQRKYGPAYFAQHAGDYDPKPRLIGVGTGVPTPDELAAIGIRLA